MKNVVLAILLTALSLHLSAQNTGRWSAEKAKQWYAQQGWINGANFIPSNRNQPARNVAG